MRSVILALFVIACVLGLAQECPPPKKGEVPPEQHFGYVVFTDEFWFEATGSDGAVDDIVPVTILLHSRLVDKEGPLLGIALCHNPQAGEIVGDPIFSEELVSMVGPLVLNHVVVEENQGATGDPKGNGVFLAAGIQAAPYQTRFPSEAPLPIATVYYRLKGEPGQTLGLTFCDGQLARFGTRCTYSRMHVNTREIPQGWDYMSTLNQADVIHVLDGPATHPERPPEPPKAKVYPERPTPERVNFQVLVSGALAAPGVHEVPIEVRVSADVEYSGIQVPIDFDERYLRLVRVEKGFLNGAVVINNHDELPGPGTTEGYAVIFSGQGPSTRRLADEGEVVKAGTLYFDVLEAAAEVEATTLSVVTVGTEKSLYAPWVGVHYRDGSGVEAPVVRSEVNPIVTKSGLLGLGAPFRVLRGDGNFDRRFNVSDPISVLRYLFQLADALACPNAADFNLDARLDISDPISMLRTLFMDFPLPGGTKSPLEVPCE